MKSIHRFTTGAAIALVSGSLALAQETTTDISGLEQAAGKFVVAYNNRDAAAIAALFTEDGEISDLHAENITSGREDILARYQEMFEDPDNAPFIAIEVDSVRLLAPNLAVEDGTVHLTPPVEGARPRSWQYTATLLKGDDGNWLIASSRDLRDVTDAAGQLADLAKGLDGAWTCMNNGTKNDIVFSLNDTGTFILGEMLSTSPDSEPQTTNIRIGWNGARNTITWWTYDDEGGFAEGDWAETEDGWVIHTTGTTAEGEAVSSNQHLRFENEDTILWKATDRIIDGEALPDNLLRIVRPAPEPAAE